MPSSNAWSAQNGDEKGQVERDLDVAQHGALGVLASALRGRGEGGRSCRGPHARGRERQEPAPRHRELTPLAADGAPGAKAEKGRYAA